MLAHGCALSCLFTQLQADIMKWKKCSWMGNTNNMRIKELFWNLYIKLKLKTSQTQHFIQMHNFWETSVNFLCLRRKVQLYWSVKQQTTIAMMIHFNAVIFFPTTCFGIFILTAPLWDLSNANEERKAGAMAVCSRCSLSTKRLSKQIIMLGVPGRMQRLSMALWPLNPKLCLKQKKEKRSKKPVTRSDIY